MINLILLGSKGCLGTQLKKTLKNSNIIITEPLGSVMFAESPIRWLEHYICGESQNIIVNCAAITGLERCAKDRLSAYIVNSHLPIMLSFLSNNRNIRVLQISTDNVFQCDDINLLPNETDEPMPNTWYGKTKLLGEAACIDGNNFEVLRLPLMFGPENESQIIGKLINEACCGKVIKVAADVLNTPISSIAVAEQIKRWINSPKGFGRKITHLAGDRRISLYDFMQKINGVLNSNWKITAVKSTDFPSVENKPLFGGLSSNFLPTASLDLDVKNYAAFLEKRHVKIKKLEEI